MTNNLGYYKESGTIDKIGIFKMIFIGLIGSLLGAVAYSFFIYYIPLIYFNVFATVIFGYVISYSISYGAKIGKIRNSKLIIFLTLITSIVSIYFHWIIWLGTYLDWNYIYWFPTDIYNLMRDVAEGGMTISGRYGSGGFTIPGNLYPIIWVVEALIILYISFTKCKPEEAFCEVCENWVKDKNELKFKIPENLNFENFKSILEKGEIKEISSLEKLENLVEGDHLLLTFSSCDTCGGTSYLSLDNMKYKVTKKESNYNKKPIIKKLLVTKENYNYLKSL